MKHKVSELEGALLDAAVAKAEGKTVIETDFGTCWIAGKVPYQPSTDWILGGPIIERERLLIVPKYKDPANCTGQEWYAEHGKQGLYGPTPLIAAMRAYVASKLGETVELP